VQSAARELQGLDRMEQIRFAVLETDGQISIVPDLEKAQADPTPARPQAATPPPR
jgi:uncharacterized membrane protein YcaP (DUF421 family)